MEFLIPRALYIPSSIPEQPEFDTLIGICNPYDEAQLFELHFYDMQGIEVPLSPLKYTLEAGHSLATTLIKNNIFPNPPQGFQGYAKLVVDKLLPVTCCLGGNGPTPFNWNYASYNVPVLNNYQVSYDNATKRIVFPYAIPYFKDVEQHVEEHEYRTGLSITNLGNDVNLSMTYTVGDIYPNAGHKFNINVIVPAGTTLVKQLHELFPWLLDFNSEGWLDITSEKPANIMAYLLPANKTFRFFGFGESPFVLS